MRTTLVVVWFAIGLGAITGCSDSAPPVNTAPANEPGGIPVGQYKAPGTDHQGPGKGRLPKGPKS